MSNKIKILCVDDEELGLRIRQLTLESQGYEVTTARDGRSALGAFAQQPFDLVILDYSMPGRNGGEIAAEMRRNRPGVPIILLSAYVTLPQKDVDMVNLFLTKADPPAKFLDHVSRVLQSKESEMERL
jgi:CheY-like chemotaxis protein